MKTYYTLFFFLVVTISYSCQKTHKEQSNTQRLIEEYKKKGKPKPVVVNKKSPEKCSISIEEVYRGFIGPYPVQTSFNFNKEKCEITGIYTYTNNNTSIAIKGQIKDDSIFLEEKGAFFIGKVVTDYFIKGVWKKTDANIEHPFEFTYRSDADKLVEEKLSSEIVEQIAIFRRRPIYALEEADILMNDSIDLDTHKEEMLEQMDRLILILENSMFQEEINMDSLLWLKPESSSDGLLKSYSWPFYIGRNEDFIGFISYNGNKFLSTKKHHYYYKMEKVKEGLYLGWTSYKSGGWRARTLETVRINNDNIEIDTTLVYSKHYQYMIDEETFVYNPQDSTLHFKELNVANDTFLIRRYTLRDMKFHLMDSIYEYYN